MLLFGSSVLGIICGHPQWPEKGTLGDGFYLGRAVGCAFSPADGEDALIE